MSAPKISKTMRRAIYSAPLIAALLCAAVHTAPAHADPDNGYDDDPGYTTVDGGGTAGVEHWPSVCAVSPIGCGMHRDPGRGTWIRPDPEPYH
jgi:hypothetical protein